MKKNRLKLILFILLFGALHLAAASLSFASDMQASWRLGLAGIQDEDRQASSKFVGLAMDAKMKYWLHPEFFLNLEPLVKFENGSFQSIDGARKNESGLTLREAGVHWFVLPNALVSAGALNQSTQHSELLIGNQAFPAVNAQLKLLQIGSLHGLVYLTQAIPTSNSLSTETNGVEATPQFQSASFALHYETPTYFWKTRLGVFSYDHLPSAVAYQSALRGNTAVSLTASESLFVYDYSGLEVNSELRIPVLRGWDLLASAAYLKNEKAIDELNQAHSLSLGCEFFLVGQKSLEMRLTSFRIEPDATVSYFSSSRFFSTNRVGYNAESFLNFHKYNFKVGVGYSEAEVIYLNPVLSREKRLMLMLETSYANI